MDAHDHGRPTGRALRRSLGSGAAVLLIVLLAACSRGPSGGAASSDPSAAAPPAAAVPTPSDPPGPSPSSTPAAPAATVSSGRPADAPPAVPIDPRQDGLDVTFGEFAITLEAPVIRPGRVTLVVHNAGHLTHGFEMQLDRSGKGGGDRRKVETRTFRSGETLRVEADLPPGSYEIECYVAGHASKGMRVALQVRADAPLQTPDAATAAPGSVRIVQFAFVPATVEVGVGDTVRWTNDDPAPHTVTADGGAFDSKQLDPGADYAVVLDRPGTFAFHCEIHPTMVGMVHVR